MGVLGGQPQLEPDPRSLRGRAGARPAPTLSTPGQQRPPPPETVRDQPAHNAPVHGGHGGQAAKERQDEVRVHQPEVARPPARREQHAGQQQALDGVPVPAGQRPPGRRPPLRPRPDTTP